MANRRAAAVAALLGALLALSATGARGAGSPAAAVVSLSETSGTVGSTVLITGAGFPPNAPITTYLDTAGSAPATAPRVNGPSTDSNGAFQITESVPPAAYGAHVVCAETVGDASVVYACAQLSIQPSLSLNASSGPPGTPLHIAGRGFPAFAVVALYVDQPNPYFGTPGPNADAIGDIDLDVGWWREGSAATAGQHSVCGETYPPDSPSVVHVKACAPFTVIAVPTPPPALSVSVSSPAMGDTVVISGLHFPPGEAIVLTLNGSTIADWTNHCGNLTSDITGGFEAPIVLSAKVPTCGGSYVAVTAGRAEICAGTIGIPSICTNFDVAGSMVLARASLPAPISGIAIAIFVSLAALGGGGALVWLVRRREREI